MTRTEAIAYINAAGDDHEERLRRKAQVFHIVYGGSPFTKGVVDRAMTGQRVSLQT